MAGNTNDEAGQDQAAQELKALADRLFPGAVRELAVLRYGDAPVVEPGEIMVRIEAPGQPVGGIPEDQADPMQAFEKSAMQEFRQAVMRRLPEVRRIEVSSDDPGHKGRRLMRIRTDDEGAKLPPGRDDLAPVMVRMRAAELEIVDTLISAGIAPNRAEAVRWALGRIGERPAYAQLRERTREIEELKKEF